MSTLHFLTNDELQSAINMAVLNLAVIPSWNVLAQSTVARHLEALQSEQKMRAERPA